MMILQQDAGPPHAAVAHSQEEEEAFQTATSDGGQLLLAAECEVFLSLRNAERKRMRKVHSFRYRNYTCG